MVVNMTILTQCVCLSIVVVQVPSQLVVIHSVQHLLPLVILFGKIKKRKEKLNENCTLLISKGNSYCRHKSTARDPWFKVSFEGLSREIDILIQSSIKIQAEVDVS